MKWRLPRLGDRAGAQLAQMSTVVLLVLGLLLAGRNEATFRRNAVSQTVAQADVLAASLTAALAFDDRPALTQYVQALRANRRIASAAVYDAAGRRVVELASAGEPPPPAHIDAPRADWENGRATAVRISEEGGQRLGYVFLQYRKDTAGSLFARHAGVALLTLTGLLLLVMVGAGAGRLQRRAMALAEANRRLQDEVRARGRAEEALRQSQKMEALGQLTGGIAHDFNNLLQVIVGGLELIRRRSGEPGRVEALAANALKAADRGASLTRQLLAFSRTQKLDLRPFVVSDLVAGMREMLDRTLGPDIEFVLQLEADGVAVVSDRTQVELAILNLAINARDAMPDGGRLTLRAELTEVGPGDPALEAGAYVALSVSDTGEGMAPEVAERAFDPFFTTKGVGKGTGLGLSQVYGVARQAGGGVRLASVAGAGTTVTLLLRRSEAPAEADGAVSAVDSAIAPVDGATILVVDDDDDVRMLLRETLELLGYAVLDADGGKAALRILENQQPAAMIADFAMPHMNGAQLADAARAMRPDLPILFASGHADTEAIRRAVGEDAVILRKPYEMDSLSRALARLVVPPPHA